MMSLLIGAGRYDADGRRLGLQICPSRKQNLRQALKRETARRRAAALQARLVAKAEVGCGFPEPRVDPIDRAKVVNRFREAEMTEDEVDELVRIVEAHLSGSLCAAGDVTAARHRYAAHTCHSA
jgi:hypothetical protein